MYQKFGKNFAVKPVMRRTPIEGISAQDRTPDAVILDVLDRIGRQCQTMKEAGAAHGMTRSAVAGMIKRVRESGDDCAGVTRPENRNGAMGPRWWEAGLAARVAS